MKKFLLFTILFLVLVSMTAQSKPKKTEAKIEPARSYFVGEIHLSSKLENLEFVEAKTPEDWSGPSANPLCLSTSDNEGETIVFCQEKTDANRLVKKMGVVRTAPRYYKFTIDNGSSIENPMIIVDKWIATHEIITDGVSKRKESFLILRGQGAQKDGSTIKITLSFRQNFDRVFRIHERKCSSVDGGASCRFVH